MDRDYVLAGEVKMTDCFVPEGSGLSALSRLAMTALIKSLAMTINDY